MRVKVVVFQTLCLLVLLACPLKATNGVEVIGAGPTSRSMGGVGVAHAGDAVGTLFNNPAAISQLKQTQFDLAGSILWVDAHADVTAPTGNFSGWSESQPWAIPAIGLVVPMSENFHVGLGVIGTAGLGVDYRNKDPLDLTTNLGLLQFINAASLRFGNLSLGAALQVDYQSVDIGEGESHAWGVGGQFGAVYELGIFSFGASYRTPHEIRHKRVAELDQPADNVDNKMRLDIPQKVHFGVAIQPHECFVLEVDGKWIDWEHAESYRDMDWDSQWVIGVGAEIKPVKGIALRVGYSYGTEVLNDHDGWNPNGTSFVQSRPMSTLKYEYLRVIGLPAVLQHHIGAGVSLDLNEHVTLLVGATHAFRGKIRETAAGGAADLKSLVRQTFLDFGVSVRF